MARRLAAEAGLGNLEIVTGYAPLTSQYTNMTPAYLVLVCGMFGNMTDADIERTIGYCTQLRVTAGTVVWTRDRSARGAPDLVAPGTLVL